MIQSISNFDQHYVWALLLVCMHHIILEHVDDCPGRCLLTLRAIPNTLCPAILYTQRGTLPNYISQTPVPTGFQMGSYGGGHSQEITVKTEKTDNFVLSLSRLGLWQWQRLLTPRCLVLPDRCFVLFSFVFLTVLIPTGQWDPAFSIVLGFLQLLHSELLNIPVFHSSNTF